MPENTNLGKKIPGDWIFRAGAGFGVGVPGAQGEYECAGLGS